jgi:SHS2 domain-containing protein
VYRWVDHTAELELEIAAPREEDVFADALDALAELLASPAERAAVRRDRPPERRVIQVDAGDRPALLAAWLEELVFLADADGFVGMELEQIELGPDRVEATVLGHIGEPAPLVKAVTYHRLEFRPAGEEYRARVVLDV